MPKDARAFIFYIITTIVLWQFGISVRDICLKPEIMAMSASNPVFSFVYLKNTGGAFGVFSGYADLLSIFGVLALFAILIYVYKKVEFKDKFKILTGVSLSAGILGNLYERLTLGYVTDFIKLNFVNFAVFNFFDILISVSIVLIAGLIIYEDIQKRLGNKG